MIKRIIKILVLCLVSLVALAFVIPVFFKKQVTELVKKEVNKNITAKVDFKEASLSLFRHFPSVTLSLDNLSVVGTNEFQKDTLVSAGKVEASLNLISVIKGNNIKVNGIYLYQPRIHALVNNEGKANWDIMRSTGAAAADTSASAFKMTLEKYAINDGYIYYNDAASGMNAEISGLDHEGSGDFTADLFALSTSTKATSASFTYGPVTYLSNANAEINGDIQIDTKNSKYSFKTDDIAVNNLKLSTEGFFQFVNDSVYNMDIKFRSPSNDFKDILSLIPGVYKKDFDNIKTSGKALFNGYVKGLYGPQQLPGYDVKLEVKDGFFQYPDLPDPVKNIQLAAHITNPDGKMDNTVVDVSNGHLEMGNEPFDFKLLFKNPETSRYIDAVAKGKLNLGDVSKFVKLEAGTKLAGLVWADVFAKGNMSALQNQQGDFSAGGFLDIKDLYYTSSSFPQPLQNGNMKVQIANTGGVADNTVVDINAGHIEAGKDPVDFTLHVSKPMSATNFSGTAKGRFTLDNIKEFVTLEPGTSIAGVANADLSFDGNKMAIDKKEYDKIKLNGTGDVQNVHYTSKDYPTGINVSYAGLELKDGNAALKDMKANFRNTNFTASGKVGNLIGYVMNDQPLTGVVNVGADKMNLNEWMGTDTAATTTAGAASDPFAVPANLNLTINAVAQKVRYDKVDYNNISGALQIADETVKLQNVKTEALDGSITFNGAYSTKADKKQPAIDLTYDVKDLDVQKTFYAFNTIQKIMPIGQFLDGKLSSQLSMTGKLNNNMMPLLPSLTGKGNLLLLEGVLKKFAPLEQIASVLDISELKSVALKDVKNYIEFANGKVLVKPFTVKIKDIEMQIGGMHGFDQSIQYAVQMKVPRKYLGTQGNSLLNNLSAKAVSSGIPVTLGDMVDLNIKMDGTLANPLIKTDLKQVAGDAVKDMQQQAVAFAKAKADTIKQTIKDTLTAIKNQTVKDLKEEAVKQLLDTKDSSGGNNLDSSKKKATQTLKNTLNNLFKKKKSPADTSNSKQ
ncbi:MAG: hypothetical protein HYR66_17585 [Sphingobacteriales bacterium]|nr:hypothetical protein [Sphingobacteriales bacterium]MBI3717142.1 hypothetical protein [Sphingobacteriales bacterium]